MTYKKHSTFQDPPDPHQPVWRYLDLAKFTHLLATNRLHFTRLDQFKDPFEGSATPAVAKLLATFYERAADAAGVPESMRETPDDLHEYLLDTRDLRCSSYVSCWHSNTYESAAMWSQYLASGEGIAIRTTLQRLKDSFEPAEEDVYVGAIRYVDYETDDFHDPGNMFSFALHKRRSFEHEREIRALVSRWGPDSPATPIEGIDLPINLRTLVERVYVAPGTGTWFADTVAALVRAFGHDIQVVRSTLLDMPNWHSRTGTDAKR